MSPQKAMSRLFVVSVILLKAFSNATKFALPGEANAHDFQVQNSAPGLVSEALRSSDETYLAEAKDKSIVEVEMFVMSMCPDARDCVSDLVLPAMAEIYDSGILSLKPTYIGKPDDANAGMACMHGPDECLGDILELCAYEDYKDNPKIWLGFIHCMGQNYRKIGDDEFVHGCAKDFGIDFEKLQECAASTDPDRGMELLRTSARRAQQLGIQTSCTITINHEKACTRDGGQWKDCSGKPDDLVQEIKNAYNDTKSS